jgi:hypothetical protein
MIDLGVGDSVRNDGPDVVAGKVAPSVPYVNLLSWTQTGQNGGRQLLCISGANAPLSSTGRAHSHCPTFPTFRRARAAMPVWRFRAASAGRVTAPARWAPPRKTPSMLSRAEAGARCPVTLSPATWAFLARHVERAFGRQGTQETLRRAVRRAVAEMQSQGVGGADVCQALERAVTDHPACARFDRMLIVTGQLHSRSVIATIHAWALAEMAPLPE